MEKIWAPWLTGRPRTARCGRPVGPPGPSGYEHGRSHVRWGSEGAVTRIRGVLPSGRSRGDELHRDRLGDGAAFVPDDVEVAAARVDEGVVGCARGIHVRRAGRVAVVVGGDAALGDDHE